MKTTVHCKCLATCCLVAGLSWLGVRAEAATFYVQAGASGSGASWADATGNLQGAIEACRSAGGGEVWVTSGTYVPTLTPNGGAGSRQVHFSLRNGVTVYGGFPSVGSPTMAQRDPEAYPTVCSGAIGAVGPEDNVYHIFHHPDSAALDATAVLDGVRIEKGNADSMPHHQGGGMYNDNCSPTIRNCVFYQCRASEGAAMFNAGAHPEIRNCAFVENSATYSGGGIQNSASSSTVLDCLFSNNFANVMGGGTFNAACNPVFSNCVFAANTADSTGIRGEGSAIYNASASARVYGCLFKDNYADQKGCVFEDGGSSSRFYDCTFRRNSSWWGGAVYCNGANNPIFVKCLFQDNIGRNAGGGVFLNGGEATFLSCVLDGNRATVSVGGGIDANYARGVFWNTVITDNSAPGDGGGAALSSSECLFINCTITRNDADAGGGVAFWGPGHDQFYNCIVRYNEAGNDRYDNLQFNHSGGRDFAYCNVWHDFEVYPGTGNSVGEVYFMNFDNPDGVDNTWRTDDDGLRISSGSACRNTGSLEALPSDALDLDGDGNTSEPLPLDILEHIRVNGATVDVGAYEYGAAPQPVYSVDFVLGARGLRVGGGALHQDVIVDHAAVAPLVAGQDGWSFTGWDADFSRITADLVVNAQYSLNTHTVTFDLGTHAHQTGGGDLVQNVPHGSAATAPRIVVDPGWYFRGWDTAFDNVTVNLTVHALVQQIVAGGDIVYVKVGGIGNGSSWALAMGDLQAAFDYMGARGAGQVWVARGTYKPNSWPHGGATAREMHFSLRDNVRVYGGFPSTGTPGLGDRDWIANPTYLSGDLGEAYDPSDNVYHVLYHPLGTGLTTNSLLDGFVVEWGNADATESPNSAGGGMRNEACAPTIVRCAFGENQARYGGGAYIKYGPSPVFNDVRFSDNLALVKGGGMRNYAGARPRLADCVFHSNEADWGGGMANDLSSPKMKHCTFDQNTAADWGGGMHNAGGLPDLANCLFEQNTADDGGALYNTSQTHPWLANVILYNNTATFSGGALYNDSGAAPTLWHCTIAGNTAGQGGGFFNWSAAPTLNNSILWNNTGGSFFSLTSTSTVHHCILQGGFAGGTVVLDQDPVFANAADPNGADNEWFTPDDGLRILPSSPALNRGDNARIPVDFADLDDDLDAAEFLPVDAVGAARQVGLYVDMGAYEYPTPVTHTVTFDPGAHGTRNGGGALVQEIDHHGAAVAPVLSTDIGWAFTGWDRAFDDVTEDMTVSATYDFVFEAGDICYVRKGGDGNGSSWDEATGDLQGAIEVMSSIGGGQVWVGAATYVPSGHPNGGSGARQQHFSLRNGVTVLGGFEAEGNPGLGDRDPGAYPTLCSAAIGAVGVATDNTYHVFYHPAGAALNATAILDGFTLAGGYADGSAPHNSGGGMYNSSCSPTLRTCALDGNYALRGGGMYNLGSSPRLTRCVFENNIADEGGGMRNYSASSPSLVNCVFRGNSATDGGAMHDYSSSPSLVNCVVVGNTASDEGGGIYNSASAPLVYLSTFHANGAGTAGGGIYNTSASGPSIQNGILWGNTAPAGSNLFDSATSDSLVGYSTVGGGWAEGHDILDTDPLFADEDLRLGTASPAINAGGNGSLPPDSHDLDGDGNTIETLPEDLAGNARVVDVTVDQGAYEYETAVHTVTFDLGTHGARTGGGALVQRVAHGDAAAAPEFDTEEGWAFTGWDRAFDAVTDDLLVTAEYLFITYTVTFDIGPHGTRVGGGELSQVVPHRGAAVAPVLTVVDHWYFVGWDAEFDEVTGDLDVAAVYAHIQATDGICYVKEGGTGSGSSWADAMGDLQAAINEIRLLGTGQVWVAAGTYHPNSWPHGGTGEVRAMHFALAKNVQVYGGFPATGNPGLAERAPSAYLSLCSGDLGAPGDASDNAYHVFHHSLDSALDRSALLDGFTLSYGQAAGAFPHNSGGGMLNRESSPTLRNCTFSDNVAAWGGAMHNMNSSHPRIDTCSFIKNEALWGGAIECLGESSPSIHDSLFRNNLASRGAGLYSFQASSQEIVRCTFANNRATEDGGAFYLDGECGTVSRNQITGNRADRHGGGAVLANGSTLFGSLVASNLAGNSGGGVYLLTTGRLESCTIAANTAGKNGGGLCMEGSGSVAACIIYGNTAAASGPNGHDPSALGTYDHCCSTPEIAGPALVTDAPSFVAPAAGNFRLAADSPCIDAGPAGADVSTDLDGLPRPLDGDADGVSVIDIGAYETLNEDGDSDGDDMRDGYEMEHGLDLLDPADALENPDKDPFDNRAEAIADTDPFDPGSYLRITMILMMPEPTLYYWPASTRRAYTVCISTNLNAGEWDDEPAATRVIPPASGLQSFHLFGRGEEVDAEIYRIRVSYP